MAKSYIKEIADKKGKGLAATEGAHVKTIAPVYYRPADNSADSAVTTIQGALDGKASSTHSHGNIANGGTLTDTAAAAAGNDYVVIRDADNAKIQTSTIKGTDVADAVSKKHSHSTLTLSTTAQAYDGTHTLALPSTDPYTSARTPASHTHGNIQNGGTLQSSDVAIANGDKLVITDLSDSSKVARASIRFDGSTATKALTQKGTWETFNNYTHPTTAGNKHVPSGGSSGQFLGWSADGTAAWVANPNTDTKVTSSANHYTPETASGSDKTASASGATAAWSIDVVKGVTLNTDGKGHVTGLSVTSGKIPANPNTDTKVTSAANHYTPETASGSDKTASASGATAAWSIDVVKGVTLNTDGKGHVTGLSVTSGKIPANPNTDTKQNVTLATTSKAFITGVTTTPTSSAQALTGVADTGVYLTTNAGELNAAKYKINEACTMQYNSSTMSVDFVF